MDVIRTFLAAYPDPATLLRLTELMGDLRSRLSGVRWAPDHQLHFTLRFFGDLDDEARARVDTVLAAAAPALAPVAFPLDGLGAFPDWDRPRVLWVGAGAGREALEEMTRGLEVRFAAAGLSRADRPFRAHLTVARFKEGERLPPAAAERLRHQPFKTPPLTVTELRLMGSRLGRGGATHTLLATYPLRAGTY